MKRSIQCLGVFALCFIAGSALASCDKTSSTSSTSVVSIDSSVAGVQVKDGTYHPSFQQYYDTSKAANLLNGLVIQTVNKSGGPVGEIAYALSPTSFSHGAIDTTVIGNDFTFELSVRVGLRTLKTPAHYVVTPDIPSSWTPNKNYSDFQKVASNVSDDKNIDKDTGKNPFPFMKKTDFYVGNQNAMSLFPRIIPDNDDLTVSYIDTLGRNDVSVFLFDANSQSLNLTDYFDETDLTNLYTKGLVKFKESQTGKFTLKLRYLDGSDSQMPDIAYSIHVISGYNINEAKDLFVLNNDDRDGNNGEGVTDNDAKIASWKISKGIPTDRIYSTGIFQNDVILGPKDIPDNYIWDHVRDNSLDQLDGSLKDFSPIVKHTFLSSDSEENKTLSIFGNYHKISLAPDFPFITKQGTASGAITGSMVEGHASLFSAFTEDGAPGLALMNNSRVVIQDLQSVGNQGVSTDSDGLKTGLIFFKPFVDSNIENCISTNFYTTIVACRYDNVTGAQPTISVKDSRFNNTFNTSIFNWNAARIDVLNSEIMNAGGPLIFNQSPHYDYRNYDISAPSFGDGTTAHPTPAIATINIDADSYLENWVVGAGGWFKQYSAEEAVTNLKMANLRLIPYTGNKSSFLDNGFTAPGETGIGRLNLLVLTMPDASGITATEAAVFAKVNIGEKAIVDYDGGRLTCLGKLASQDRDPSGLYTTPFGALSVLDTMFASSPNAMLFGTGDQINGYRYANMTADFRLVSLDSTVMSMLGSSASEALDPAFGTMKYMNLNMLGSYQKTDFGSANPYAKYLGSNSYGLLLGIKHSEA